MKAFIKQQHCAHSHFKWLDFPWKRRLLTPRRAATQAIGWEMGWWVVGAIGGMQQATGIGVFRAPLSARHSFSVFPRRNPADSQLAFLHKFPPNATLHCGISISGCPGCRFWP